ncbi:PEGA domain-containing protein [Cellulosilyticum sp. I15G10I2]|uniref:PEGA domain-containing protein n=1 Tax=Cellulosilyticum sp. I15G10I2 TaxID=1892843 RepID=UPI00085CBD1A|nr:PEGA domain-containing protein [Cellulosilyticum sp. I15G10I2]
MRRNNKTFVKSMIITSIIGFSVLMVMMFTGIKYYVDKSGTSSHLQASNIINAPQPKVEYSSTIIALVKRVSKEELVAFDIEKKQDITRSIASSTKISDGYGGIIPLSSIKTGDLVEVIFQPDKENILAINKTLRTWVKPELSGVIINPSKNEIIIGKKAYNFTDDIMMFKEDGRGIKAAFIGEYDILELQGVEDTVWSVQVLQSAASIELIDLPSLEGRLEIDRTRMIALKDIVGPISLTPGKHKLLVDIKGYEPITEEVELASGEHLEITLKDAKEAFTELNVVVMNQGVDYSVQVGDQTFKKGQPISVKQDKYTIIVSAQGYKTWERELELDRTAFDLNITLEKEEDEVVSPVGSESNTSNNSNNGNTNNNNSSSTNNTNTSNNTYTINISSDPSGAYVYIGGIYKGQTPFKTTLPVGDYAISLEKAGYQNYYTNIIIDNSDNQNSFLYVLTPD